MWLTPFYPSPIADHRYDVADPRGVDPVFGDLAAFDALVAWAHDRGMRVTIDVVPNHTPDRHDWFRATRAAPPAIPRGRATSSATAVVRTVKIHQQLAFGFRWLGVDAASGRAVVSAPVRP